MDSKLVKQSIEGSFSEFRLEAIEFIAEGYDSQAYLVNNDYIFRFPMFKRSGKQLEIEINLLPRLQRCVGVPIPNFEYVGSQPGNKLPFVGYRKIAGVPLEGGLLASLDPTLRNRLIQRLAEFLYRLHSFSLDVAQSCGVTVSDERQHYSGVFERTRREIAIVH